MNAKIKERGFKCVEHETYIDREVKQVISESSAIDFECSDSTDNPGSSYLWIGNEHHLDRNQVAELIKYMQGWLDNKRIPISIDKPINKKQTLIQVSINESSNPNIKETEPINILRYLVDNANFRVEERNQEASSVEDLIVELIKYVE